MYYLWICWIFLAFIYIRKCVIFSLVAMHAMWINACGAGDWDSTLDGDKITLFYLLIGLLHLIVTLNYYFSGKVRMLKQH